MRRNGLYADDFQRLPKAVADSDIRILPELIARKSESNILSKGDQRNSDPRDPSLGMIFTFVTFTHPFRVPCFSATPILGALKTAFDELGCVDDGSFRLIRSLVSTFFFIAFSEVTLIGWVALLRITSVILTRNHILLNDLKLESLFLRNLLICNCY